MAKKKAEEKEKKAKVNDGRTAIGKWIKIGGNRRIRVARNIFKGRDLVDIRTHYMAHDGTFQPTKMGISMSRGKIPELMEYLKEAYEKWPVEEEESEE